MSTASAKPRVAVIGTGGTISSIGAPPLVVQDYSRYGRMMQSSEIIERYPEVHEVADVIAVDFRNVGSTNIGFSDWKALVDKCSQLVAETPDLAGIVIGHGTATLEETAYFLNLTLKVPVPVVVVGAMRPASALSSDAGMNLVNAVRTAGDPASRGLGVLVLLNDEIQAARDVTKSANLRLNTFKTADLGILGYADGDAIAYYRRPIRKSMPDTEFDISLLEELPRVEISYSHTGAEGTAVRAFVAAGVKGIVSAGVASGGSPPRERDALKEASAAGIMVVQSSRASSGRVQESLELQQSGFIRADNLTPQKARLLLSLGLTVTSDRDELQRIFSTY